MDRGRDDSPPRLAAVPGEERTSTRGRWGEAGTPVGSRPLPWPLDLQLFAEGGEKTEPATPRRRQEARRKGQVFKSVDLSSAVILLVGFAVIYLTLPYMLGLMKDFLQRYFSNPVPDFTIAFACAVLLDAMVVTARMVTPLLGAMLVAGLLVNLLQVGLVFSGEGVTIKPERLNPVEGFKRIFSKRAMVELAKSLLKIGLVGWVVYAVIRKHLGLFPRFVDMEPAAMLQALALVIFEMALKVGLVLLVIGILDYFYQWWEHERSLRMSKEEVKQEYKQVEGDPHIRNRRRQRQRELALRRMMQEVPKADVVITNPTHFAVALRYDGERMEAPQVVAKGQDLVALRIRELAQQHEVAVVENPALARTLYYAVQVGDPVPEKFYQAVAEVLAFVYRTRRKAL